MKKGRKQRSFDFENDGVRTAWQRVGTEKALSSDTLIASFLIQQYENNKEGGELATHCLHCSIPLMLYCTRCKLLFHTSGRAHPSKDESEAILLKSSPNLDLNHLVHAATRTVNSTSDCMCKRVKVEGASTNCDASLEKDSPCVQRSTRLQVDGSLSVKQSGSKLQVHEDSDTCPDFEDDHDSCTSGSETNGRCSNSFVPADTGAVNSANYIHKGVDFDALLPNYTYTENCDSDKKAVTNTIKQKPKVRLHTGSLHLFDGQRNSVIVNPLAHAGGGTINSTGTCMHKRVNIPSDAHTGNVEKNCSALTGHTDSDICTSITGSLNGTDILCLEQKQKFNMQKRSNAALTLLSLQAPVPLTVPALACAKGLTNKSGSSHKRMTKDDVDSQKQPNDHLLHDPFVHATSGTVNSTSGYMYERVNATNKRPKRKNAGKWPYSYSYACKTCGASFTRTNHLVRHMQTHRSMEFGSASDFATTIRSHVCTVCKAAFAQSSHLSRHMMTHTGERPFPCQFCGQRFQDGGCLTAHMRTHTGEKPFACSFCGAAFVQKGTMKAHERIHTGEKPFMCGRCGVAFRTSTQLTRHTRVHTGERPYICAQCGKAFKRNFELSRHKLTHSKTKPCICAECGAAFYINSELKQHAAIHKSVKPFSCSVCQKAFVTQARLKKHAKLHSIERKHACSECNAAYHARHKLKKHMKNVHELDIQEMPDPVK